MSRTEIDDDCPCCECQCDCSFVTEIIRQPSFRKNVLTYIFLITCTYFLVAMYYSSAVIPRIRPYKVQLGNMNPVWFSTRCMQIDDHIGLSIFNISSHLSTWRNSTHTLCREMYLDFSSFYSLDGEVDASEFLNIIQSMDSLTSPSKPKRPIASIENRFTRETTIFFHSGYDLYSSMQCYTGEHPVMPIHYSDIILHYIHGGSIYGQLSISQKLSSMSLTDFSFLFEQAFDWYRVGYIKDPTYCFPHLLLDLSVHDTNPVTAHLILTSQRFYGYMDTLVSIAIHYETERPANSNYFVDILKIHNMLGLVVKHGEAYALSYLTPSRGYEMWVLSEWLDQDTKELTFAVIRTLLRDFNLTQISMSVIQPPLADVYPGIHQHLKLPVFIRVYSSEVCTGPITESIFEMLAASRAFHDPFRLSGKISQNVIRKFQTIF